MYTIRTVSKGSLLNNQGSTNARAIFWILFIAAAGYIVYMFAPPYATYYMFKTEVEEEVKLAHMYPNEKMLDRLMEKVKYWKVPIEREDIKISRTREDVTIAVYYMVTLNFPNAYSRDLHYFIEVKKPLMESSGVLH